MERHFSLVSLVLLCSIAVISWPALNAEEAKSKTSDLQNAEAVATISKLLDRVEALEQRINALEQQNTAVRLVDSRDEVDSNLLPQIVPKATAPNAVRPARKSPPRPLSQDPTESAVPMPQDSDDDELETNGQKWRFHLLRNRPILESSSKIY